MKRHSNGPSCCETPVKRLHRLLRRPRAMPCLLHNMALLAVVSSARRGVLSGFHALDISLGRVVLAARKPLSWLGSSIRPRHVSDEYRIFAQLRTGLRCRGDGVEPPEGDKRRLRRKPFLAMAVPIHRCAARDFESQLRDRPSDSSLRDTREVSTSTAPRQDIVSPRKQGQPILLMEWQIPGTGKQYF
jgi:hypothetical protein